MYCDVKIWAFWLETAYSRPFLGSFWGIFPPSDVTHRPDPKKGRPWAETRRLTYSACDLGQRYDLGAGSRKKGQYNKKVTKVLYFAYVGGSPQWSDSTQKLHGGWCPRRNDVCQVSIWNSKGLRFYRGANFRFCYWFLNGPYNSVALLRYLWYCSFSSVVSCHDRLVQNWSIAASTIDWSNCTHSSIRRVLSSCG